MSGLAVSLAVAFLIFVWLSAELSWDRFHEHADRILRIEQDTGWTRPNTVTPFPVGPLIASSVPGVDAVVRVASPGSGYLVTNGSASFFEPDIIFVDPTFFDAFSFGASAGSVVGTGAVITESAANRYFGRIDVVGRELLVDNRVSIPVSDVIPDPPDSSTISFSIVVPIQLLRDFDAFTDSWRSNWLTTWIVTAEDADHDAVARSTTDLFKRKVPGAADRLVSIVLRPIVDVHLDENGTERLFLFGLLGVFILLLAVVNFTNLTTSQASVRSREIGMRRALGATRRQLLVQLLAESLATAVAGAVVGLLLALVSLPVMSELSGRTLVAVDLIHADTLAVFGIIVLVTGLAAGIYPAIRLSKLGSSDVFRGVSSLSVGGSTLRRSLVVFQLFVSIALTAGTVTMVRQVEHLKSKSLGYDRDQLVYVPLVTNEARSAFDQLRSSWSALPGVAGVSGSEVLPVHMGWNSYADWDGRAPDEQVLVFHNRIAQDYIETMGLDVVAGRTLSLDRPGDVTTDGHGGFLINESAARALGHDVLGKELRLGGTTGPVVGILRDFHTRSLRQPIAPFAVMLVPQNVRYAILRLEADWSESVLDGVTSTWSSVLPDHPLDVRFFDDAVQAMYASETNLSTLIQIFAGLAVFIACLGLFGLTTFNVRRRMREFAVRRVLGATQVDVLALVGRDVFLLLIVASIIANPVAWVVFNRWLEQFPYRVSFGSAPMIVATSLVGIVALGAVTYQAVRAAGTNPVEALRAD